MSEGEHQCSPASSPAFSPLLLFLFQVTRASSRYSSKVTFARYAEVYRVKQIRNRSFASDLAPSCGGNRRRDCSTGGKREREKYDVEGKQGSQLRICVEHYSSSTFTFSPSSSSPLPLSLFPLLLNPWRYRRKLRRRRDNNRWETRLHICHHGNLIMSLNCHRICHWKCINDYRDRRMSVIVSKIHSIISVKYSSPSDIINSI